HRFRSLCTGPPWALHDHSVRSPLMSASGRKSLGPTGLGSPKKLCVAPDADRPAPARTLSGGGRDHGGALAHWRVAVGRPLCVPDAAELQQEHLAHAQEFDLDALLELATALERGPCLLGRRRRQRALQRDADLLERLELVEVALGDELQLALDQRGERLVAVQ